MRKFLIRWWYTHNWEAVRKEYCVRIWDEMHPLEWAAASHIHFFTRLPKGFPCDEPYDVNRAFKGNIS